MKNKVSKLLRRTTSVVLACVMTGSTVTASAVAAPVTSTTQSFSMGRIGTVFDNVKNLLTGEGPVKKDTHSTADTFSSKRLIVKADKLRNIDKKNVIASYGGYYLLKYDSKADAKEAYETYKEYDGGTTPIAADQPVHMATGDADAGGLTNVTKSDNPLTELKENVADITKSEVKSAKKKKVIALLDTGASKSSNVIETVSMLGGSASDNNGHGEAMVDKIKEQNKNVQIISVKVLDGNGEGSVSSIVAGIAYAEKRGATIINMSLSGLATDGNAVVTAAVNQAINEGLTVVGAAGNNGRNAKYYIPGCISGAIIVGACDAKGKRIASSNYGDTVDYNVVADSTSEATATTSGYLSSHMNEDGSYDLKANTGGLFFNQDEKEITDYINHQSKFEYIKSLPVDKSKKIVVRYLMANATKLSKNDTVDSVMLKKTDACYTVLMTYVYAHKAEDGSYKFMASAPYLNGLLENGPVNAVFAKANNNGQTIKKGVSFDGKTGIATVSKNVFKKSDFGDLQMEMLVPTSLNKKSTIKVNIENEKGTILNQVTGEVSPYRALSVKLPVSKKDGSKITKSDINVYREDEETPIDSSSFTYDESEKSITTGEVNAVSSSITVKVKGNLKSTFNASWTKMAGSAKIPGYWFADTANDDGAQEEPYTKLRKGYKIKSTGISGLAGTTDSDRTQKGRLDNAGGATIPDSYEKLLGMHYGGTSVPLGRLSFKKKIDGMNFTLYKSSGTKDPVGSDPSDSDYNLPANAWCYHITASAKYYRESKSRPIQIVVLDDGGDTGSANTKWKTHWAVLGIRDYKDAYAGTDTSGVYQYQGYIIAVKWRWKGAEEEDYTRPEVWKKWTVDTDVTDPAVKPSKITVTLYRDPNTKSDTRDDVAMSEYTNIVLKSDNSWHFKVPDKKLYTYLNHKSSGKKYRYYWKEDSVPAGWKVKYTAKGLIGTVINNYQSPEPADTSVSKEWRHYDGTSNEPLVNGNKVEILAEMRAKPNGAAVWDGEGYGYNGWGALGWEKVTLNSDNSWSYTHGVPQNYTVEWDEFGWRYKGETEWRDYTGFPSDLPTLPNNHKQVINSDNDGTLINTPRVPTTSECDKSFILDNGITQNMTVDSVDVQLYKDGQPTGTVMTLNDANNWHCEVTNLDKYNTEGSYKPDDEAEAQSKLINYTWQEVPGTVKYNGKDFGSVVRDVSYSTSPAPADDDSAVSSTIITNWTPTPTIKTQAVNTQTGMKASPEGNTSVTDTVSLTNLYPKHQYTITACLYDKETGQAVSDNATLTFTPGDELKTDGTKTYMDKQISIPVNLSNLKGHSLVVYENLSSPDGAYYTGEYDLNDADQTVYVPKIGTTMTADTPVLKYNNHTSSQKDSPNGTVSLTDKVHYENLVRGYSYKVVGVLHRRGRTENAGQDLGAVVVDGKTVTSEATFNVPAGDGATASGDVNVTYTFRVPETLYGGYYVSFETLKYNDIDLTAHSDISDEGQTDMITTSVRVRKMDPDTNKPLANVKFKLLVKDSNGNYVPYTRSDESEYSLTTGEDGMIEFRDLDIGKYWVKETEVPKGYQLQKDIFELDAKESVVNKRDVDNITTPVLSTGGSGTTIFYIAAAIAAGACAIVYIIKRRKQN